MIFAQNFRSILLIFSIESFNLQIHDGADPGESVGKDPEQSAIGEAGMRGRFDRVEKRLYLTIDECRRFSFGP
jgi:hypothetical protein